MYYRGPAAAITAGGFFESLHKGLLNDGDNILINIGEGVRRSPDFVEEMMYTTQEIDSVEECERFDREQYREQLWKKVDEMYK